MLARKESIGSLSSHKSKVKDSYFHGADFTFSDEADRRRRLRQTTSYGSISPAEASTKPTLAVIQTVSSVNSLLLKSKNHSQLSTSRGSLSAIDSSSTPVRVTSYMSNSNGDFTYPSARRPTPNNMFILMLEKKSTTSLACGNKTTFAIAEEACCEVDNLSEAKSNGQHELKQKNKTFTIDLQRQQKESSLSKISLLDHKTGEVHSSSLHPSMKWENDGNSTNRESPRSLGIGKIEKVNQNRSDRLYPTLLHVKSDQFLLNNSSHQKIDLTDHIRKSPSSRHYAKSNTDKLSKSSSLPLLQSGRATRRTSIAQVKREDKDEMHYVGKDKQGRRRRYKVQTGEYGELP